MELKKYIKFIFLAVIIIGIVLVGGLTFVDYQHQEDIKTAKVNYEVASIDLIESSINVYYAYNGKYPYNLQALVRGIKEIDSKNSQAKKLGELLEKSIKDHPNFKYSVRGDEKAYKITYTDSKGEKQAVEANYEADFQDR